MRNSFLFILALFSLLPCLSQERLPDASVDIHRYIFSISINDSTDVIEGKTDIILQFRQEVPTTLMLDLDDAGMKVESVHLGESSCQFRHRNEQLTIDLPTTTEVETMLELTIKYAGVPKDGLIISKNKYGDRTFFGDNWPNRAHYYLPIVDHPAEKAFCEFIITAPDHYQVVGTGELVEETDLLTGFRLSHWKSTVPLPTKVMVFGAARFAVQYVGEYNDIPVSSWIYPQDREKGFFDYELALKVLAFMDEYIGPYPYAKLANVQSKTRYGGMENASNIFYSESSVTGDRTSETLIAHEVAHQWFGNSASEASWYHIWLSEGFATYFTSLYMEASYGREPMLTLMEANRAQIVASGASAKPVVDPSIKDLNALLSTNAYQKGAWILHMLRHKIGDKAFHQGVRTYYDRFKLSNALSKDLQEVMEEVSGQDLDLFFQQWLYQPAFPIVEMEWEVNEGKKAWIDITFKQLQKGESFQVPLEIELRFPEGEAPLRKVIDLHDREITASFKVPTEPSEIILDPDVWLLFHQHEN